MKRKVVFGTVAGLILVALPVIAFACHAAMTFNTPACERVNLTAEFQGTTDGRWYRGVLIGPLGSTTGSYRDGNLHTFGPGLVTVAAGTYTHTAKMQVAPNVHIDAVTHKEHRHKVTGVWETTWTVGACHGAPGLCEERVVTDTPAIDGPGAFSDYAGTTSTKTVTVEACYVQCSETVDQGWAYSGPAVDVGDPVWGPWVPNGDGTSTRIGVQATARHQYHYIVDAYDESICSSEFRDEPGTREVRESTDPVPGCMDPLATNYNPAATVDDQSCEYPPEPTDVCPNLEGVQETVPEGLIIDAQGNCVEPPAVCDDEAALNYNQEGECQYPQPPQPPEPPRCDATNRIWVWTLTDVNGISYTLRDLGYDGTYSSPGVAQQCFYFGCSFHAVKATGRWVNECDSAYTYWRTLPRYSGGGKCALSGAPSN